MLSLLAGSVVGGVGNVDGQPGAFNNPNTTAVDGAGNVFVADMTNHTIRKISPAGVVTTLAGTAGSAGSTDGTGAAARFNFPRGLAVDGAGNVLVADTANHTIRKISPAGVVTTLAGSAGSAGSTDGTGAAARFNLPIGLAVDGAGNVLVADYLNQTIRKISPLGEVTTLAGTAGSAGSADGTGAAARFSNPVGLAVDAAGHVLVADYGNHTIRKISPLGVVTTLAGTAASLGSADGTGAAARFNYPRGLAVDAAGNVLVADTGNHTIRKISPAGVVTTLAGTATSLGSTDGTGAAARFSSPAGLAVDAAGYVFVADTSNHTIRKISPAGVVTTLAGTAGMSGSTDGTGAAARFSNPVGLAVDGAGNVLVADYKNHTIRKISPAGVVTTLAGKAGVQGSLNGTGAAARFSSPTGLAVDGAGNVLVVDYGNNTIRKISPAGVVTTLAGTAGVQDSTDGTGAAARFSNPIGLTVDGAGNVLVADSANHTIRKISPAGVVTTLAGTAGSAGITDGTGAAARFNNPRGLAVDGAGNVLVADAPNHTIRKISPAGVVTTLAGTAGVQDSTDGTGAAARFNFPQGLAVDAAGNVLVADTSNHTIRKISPAGVVTTVVGAAGVRGFNPGPLPGALSSPIGLALQGNTLYFSQQNGVGMVSDIDQLP